MCNIKLPDLFEQAHLNVLSCARIQSLRCRKQEWREYSRMITFWAIVSPLVKGTDTYLFEKEINLRLGRELSFLVEFQPNKPSDLKTKKSLAL